MEMIHMGEQTTTTAFWSSIEDDTNSYEHSSLSISSKGLGNLPSGLNFPYHPLATGTNKFPTKLAIPIHNR
jgi:hypothetical protein